MTPEAQTIFNWASQYQVCAVDNVPFEVFKEVRSYTYWDEVWSGPPPKGIRLVDGKYVAQLERCYAGAPEVCKKHHIEAVIDYEELLLQSAVQKKEEDLFMDLEEVLG